MAIIRKRGNSYQIRVSCGYDTLGNQVNKNKTWTPEKGMTPKQIEKELNRQAVMFEEACNNGFQSKSIKFQEFAEEWFKQYAETKLKTQTVRCYHNCEKKVYKALGHLRMDKITTRTIQTFIVDLAGEKRYDSKGKELPPYAPKTVRNYISFISSIFDYAVRMQVLTIIPVRMLFCRPKRRKIVKSIHWMRFSRCLNCLRMRVKLTTSTRFSLLWQLSQDFAVVNCSVLNGKILIGKTIFSALSERPNTPKRKAYTQIPRKQRAVSVSSSCRPKLCRS